MISGIFKKMNGVLFHPTETLAKIIPKDTLKDTLIYLLILAGIFTILEALLLLLGDGAYVSILSGVAVGSFPEMALILILFLRDLWSAQSSLPRTCISGHILPAAEKASLRQGKR